MRADLTSAIQQRPSPVDQGPNEMHDHMRAGDKDMKVGGLYNWKSDPGTMLVYIGKQGTWHQFALASSPGTVWCEVLDCDLRLLEEATLDSVIALVRGYLDARDEYERLTTPPNSHAQAAASTRTPCNEALC